MKTCKICHLQFIKWNRHIRTHGISIQEYVIKFELNGQQPLCECGCGSLTKFLGGNKGFSRFKQGHHARMMSNETKSKVGIASRNSWLIPDRYETGCRAIAQINMKRWSDPKNHELQSQVMKDRWACPDLRLMYENAVRNTARDPINREKVRQQRLKEWADPVIRQKRLEAFATASIGVSRLTKPHIKIREFLQLDSLGFRSERAVAGFIVDEIHFEKRLIIEINGDYIHANPKSFQPDDLIRIRGKSYTARAKWESDALKLQKLKAAGYNVVVIWESDELLKKKEELDFHLTEHK